MAGGLLLLIFWNLDQIEFWNLHDAILDQQSPALFNPKVPKRCGGGGGGDSAHWSGDGLPFLTGLN